MAERTNSAQSSQGPAKQTAQQLLDTILQRLNLPLNPEPIYVYKPRPDGKGAALKLDLRLSPIYKDGFIKDVDGGLYLEIAPQAQKGDDGFARFGWQDAENRVTAKLGMPDITAWLLALRTGRIRGKALPDSIRSKRDDTGATLSMFHKFGDETTAIDVKFDAAGSFVNVSKSKTHRQSIKLNLQEELQVEAYLAHALSAFQLVGMR